MNLTSRKRYIIFAIIVFSLNFLLNSSLAIEEIKLDKTQKGMVEPEKLQAQISFEKIIKLAKNHSYDLKIADFAQLIARQEVKSARSEYFPKLHAYVGTEYTHNLNNSRNSYVTTVGESFINPYTRFQNILGLNLNYNLFDFGVRSNNLKASKQEVVAKNLDVIQQEEELKLTLVELYTKIIVLKRQIDLNKELLNIAKTNQNLNQRLYNAKEISKTQLDDANIKVSKINKRIYELNQSYNEELNWLSFYTGEHYQTDKLIINEIKVKDFDYLGFSDYTKTTIWQIYNAQIKQKEFQYTAAKRNYLPKVNAYGRYYLYGSNYSSYNQSLGDISPSSYTFGLSAGMPVFDGFINSANVQKARLEYEQMIVERDKAIANWTVRLSTLRNNVAYLKENIKNQNKLISQLNSKEQSTKKLLSKRLITPIEYNQVKMDLIEEKIELEKNRLTLESMLKAIEILSNE